MSEAERAQSSVLAVVLLVGIVAVGSIGVVYFGLSSTDQSREDAELERVETSFVQLNRQVDTVAYGDGGSRSVDLAVGSEGAVRQEASGRIVIESSESGELVNESIGAIVYTRDGVTYAYQAGGVWRSEGEGTEMVAAPEMGYRDATLTLPIPKLTGPKTLGGDDLSVRKVRTKSPINDVQLVTGELVTVRITSDYYRGWAEYFRSVTGATSISVDDANSTVIVALGQPDIRGNFDDGVVATGGPNADVSVGNAGNAFVDGPVAAEGTVTIGGNPNSYVSGTVTNGAIPALQPLDAAIDTKFAAARSSPDTIGVDPETTGGTVTLQGGETYLDDDDLVLDGGQTVEADLSTGNVTLLVDGNVSVSDGARIVATNPTGNNTLRIYTTGSLSLQNGEIAVGAAGVDARHLQIYGRSDMLVGIGGGGTTYFEGTVYAPRNQPALSAGERNWAYPTGSSNCDGWDTCVATGTPRVDGAIVGGPASISQSAEVYYDYGLQSVDPTLAMETGTVPPPITFLHVSIHEVEVSDAD